MSKFLLLIYISFCTFLSAFTQSMQNTNHTYLALGDSYTIGHSLPQAENFPNQTAQLLSRAGISIHPPTIIAKTGWTCEDLQSGIGKNILQTPYDIVSVLIGVNDQYSGEQPKEYAEQFEKLIQQAIQYAGKNSAHVFVLSIPDWGVTPFAEGSDRGNIAKEIESYNAINKKISEKWRVNYIDITPGSKEAAQDPSLIAADGLHPSAKEYKRWAEKLAASIQQQFH